MPSPGLVDLLAASQARKRRASQMAGLLAPVQRLAQANTAIAQSQGLQQSPAALPAQDSTALNMGLASVKGGGGGGSRTGPIEGAQVTDQLLGLGGSSGAAAGNQKNFEGLIKRIFSLFSRQ